MSARLAGVLEHDKVEAIRAMGSALASLIATSINRDLLASGHAHRLFELWLERDDRCVRFEPTELRLADKLLMPADGDLGRFVFPLYSEGLRALQPLARASEADVRELGRRLAAVVGGEQSYHELAELLWSGSLAGFGATFAESRRAHGRYILGGAQQPAPGAQEVFAERLGWGIERWNDAAWAAAQSLDAATLQLRYGQAAARLSQRAASGQLALGEPQRMALEAAASDADLIGNLEFQAALTHPELVGDIGAGVVGELVGAMIARAQGLDARVVDALGRLFRQAQGVGSALDAEGVGSSLALAVAEHGFEAPALSGLCGLLGARACSEFMAELFSLAPYETQAERALGALLVAQGPEAFFDAVDAGALSPALMTALLQQALAAGVDAHKLLAVLERDGVAVESAAAALASLPRLRESAQDLIEHLLATRPVSCAVLIEALCRDRKTATWVGDSLLQSQGRGWSEELRCATMASLFDARLGERYLLPLFRDRNAAVDVRLSALAAMEASAGLCEEATRRRPSDLMEPVEIREAVKRLRRGSR